MLIFIFALLTCFQNVFASDLILDKLDLSKLKIGCFFLEEGSKDAFLMYSDYGSSGIASINGHLYTLATLRSDFPDSSQPGKKGIEEFSAGKFKITFKGEFIHACEPEGALCPYAKGRLTLSSGKNKKSYKATEQCGKLQP